MRARAVVAGILSSAAVLVVAWQAGSNNQTGTAVVAAPVTPPSSGAAASSAATGTGNSAGTGASSAAPSAAAPSPAAPAPAAGPSGTYTGTSVSTRFGNVQVQVTMSAGTITDVTALQLTDVDGRSRQISNRAAPILRSEVLAAQSASVDGVSGATYTSDGYLQSLQSALDQAK
ncbi:FMN-binding protein [Pseudarthrobacter sp. P1]|uniref:FMN-binding protein n=1 Tax=Pseudarthrobacter sp. P1 TaxID=3418418 RepID=UPI003CF2113B